MINDILKIETKYNNSMPYVGTLRNQREFEINDTVFFIFNSKHIGRGRIVGKELPIKENADYQYKVQLSSKIVDYHADYKHDTNTGDLERVSLKCDKIFNSLKEAKESAIRRIERDYEMERRKVEQYFQMWNI